MMRPIESIIYNYLTDADFYSMYKPHGSEPRGGGQTYIDFPTRDVQVSEWENFLSDVPGLNLSRGAQGPAWDVPVQTIHGPHAPQRVRIYQRRPASVSIANQTLDRKSSNRVQAWHPDNGFPEPANPSDRHQVPAGLAVFLVKGVDKTVWAGWFLRSAGSDSPAHRDVEGELARLLTRSNSERHRAGMIELPGQTVWLDENEPRRPFQPPPRGASAPGRPSPDEEFPIPAPLAVSRARKGSQRVPRVRATDAQGFQLDGARRRAVEEYSMKLAKGVYAAAEDTSLTESYDLRTFEDGKEVRVEVKGTTGTGEYVLLTANEVENTRGTEWRTDLFVVSNIKLTPQKEEFVASGGTTHVVRGWTASEDDLRVTQYRYRVPA